MKNNSCMLKLISVLVFCGLIAAPAFTQPTKHKLQPTDVLLITVYDNEDLTTKTRVSSDGSITFPLLGNVSAKGLTAQELELKLKQLLEKDYLVSAQVVVFIEEYHPRQVSVLGEVTAPGKFDIPEEGDVTLLDAIAMAGGFTKDALLKKVKIIRTYEDGSKETLVINIKDITRNDEKEKNIILEPDDIVIVPESFF